MEGVRDCHYSGYTRLSDYDDQLLLSDPTFPKGVRVRNWRQVSIGSWEELDKISRRLGFFIYPALLGINITLFDIRNLSSLPRGTTFHFPDQTILIVEAGIVPRKLHADKIARVYPFVTPEDFKQAAEGLRGLVSTVYHPGTIRHGDKVEIRKPQTGTL